MYFALSFLRLCSLASWFLTFLVFLKVVFNFESKERSNATSVNIYQKKKSIDVQKKVPDGDIN